MENKMIRMVIVSAVLATVVALSAVAVFAYSMTASCPNDGETAYATGNMKSTSQPGCVVAEYRHSGTDYSDIMHPKQVNHVFWQTDCN